MVGFPWEDPAYDLGRVATYLCIAESMKVTRRTEVLAVPHAENLGAAEHL
jgi:hypothetical protein